jgi:hypothetical protein
MSGETCWLNNENHLARSSGTGLKLDISKVEGT